MLQYICVGAILVVAFVFVKAFLSVTFEDGRD